MLLTRASLNECDTDTVVSSRLHFQCRLALYTKNGYSALFEQQRRLYSIVELSKPSEYWSAQATGCGIEFGPRQRTPITDYIC